MPNYIVNTAQFNPIDFATRIRPMEEYAKNFNAQQDAIDAISLEGDNIPGLLTSGDEDKSLRDLYSSFDNSVTEAVNNMLATGDISAGRRAVANLSRFYKKNLEPIKEAAAARTKAITNFNNFKQKDGDYLGINPSQYGVSAYMKGAVPNIYGVSGKDLYNMAYADAKAQSARRVLVEDYKIDPKLLGQYFTRGIETGYSADDIGNITLQRILDNSNASQEDRANLTEAMSYIVDAYNRVADAYGINNLKESPVDYGRAGSYIMEGLLNGIEYKYTDDKLRNNSLEDAIKNEQLNQLRQKGQGNGGEGSSITGDIIIRPTRDDKTPESRQVSRDTEYAKSLILTPDGGVSNTTIADLDNRIAELQNNPSQYTYEKRIVKTTKPGNSAYAQLGEAMSSLTEYYRVSPDGKKERISDTASIREATKYLSNQDKIKELEKQRDEEAQKLSEFTKKYQSFRIEGIPEAITTALGVGVNNSLRSSFNTEYTPFAAGEVDSRIKSRVSQMIYGASSTETDNNKKGGSGFYDVESGKALSKKQIKAIQDSPFTITNVSEVQHNNRGIEGIKVSVTSTNKGVPSSFILRPNQASYMNHSNELWGLKQSLLDFDNSIKDVPAYSTAGRNPYDVIREASEKQIKSGNYQQIPSSQDLYMTSFKIFDEAGNPDIVKCVYQLTPAGFVPIGSTSASDIINGGSGYNGILTSLSSNYFENLGVK